MSFNTCTLCNRLYWSREFHQCPPAWMVYLDAEGYGEGDAQRFYCNESKEAATEFATHYDNGDYTLMNGGEIDVVVFLASEPTERFLYTVRGEIVPNYFVSDERHPSWAETAKMEKPGNE